MKWTPYGKMLTQIEFFVKKIDFCLMPARNQNLQQQGGGVAISVPWVQTGLKTEFGIPKIGGLHTLIAHMGRKMQKPHFWHQKLVFALMK